MQRLGLKVFCEKCVGLVVCVVALALAGVASAGERPRFLPCAERDFSELFAEHKLTGAIAFYEPGADSLICYNAARVDSAYLPASTFKIFNSLVALHTGVISSPDEVIPWDSVARGWDKWDMDQTLRSAFTYSAVWYYQVLARRIGEERMQLWVDSVGYGNRDISGGIDLFWLEGGLRMTLRLQLDLLVRLYHNDLPFSAEVCDTVKSIMIREETDSYTLRGKTGWAQRFEPQIGWFVGYVTRGADVVFFATNFSERDPGSGFTRRGIALTMDALRALNFLPPGVGK
ncbi:MAG TPA: penicillin-binding transpeptidase domain-containing protein [candidate division Zixibacteria bacterium]|nr:penicillin-binding transpeptidase domain-containing protein [candidate division Zixibacteria bacterium]